MPIERKKEREKGGGERERDWSKSIEPFICVLTNG
jgi:hypothetical protein